jgi:hypothetical protein
MKTKNKDPYVHLQDVIRILKKNQNIKVFENESLVLWDRSPGTEGTVGNKTLGKLDFLRGIGYRVYKFPNRKDFEKELKKMYS